VLWRGLSYSRRLVGAAETSTQARADLAAVLAFSGLVTEVGTSSSPSIEEFLELAEVSEGAPAAGAEGDRGREEVHVLTAHAAVGLEFDTVVVAGAAELALFRLMQGPPAVEEIVREYLRDVDLVLTEGFKEGPAPKIEINRAAQDLDLLCGPGDHLIAVVTDRNLPVEVPIFGLDAIEPLADFLEAGYLGVGGRMGSVRGDEPWVNR